MAKTKGIAILLLALVAGTTNFVRAQKIDPIYPDSTGRLFIGTGTPVQVFISPNSDGSGATLLPCEQPEGNPLIWSNHGPKLLTYLSLYSGKRIRFDLFADGLPPKTSAQFDPRRGYQKGETIYLSGEAVVELVAHDANSGTHSIYSSVNGSPFELYKNAFAFDSDGIFTIRFYAMDNVGNREDEGERIIIIDGNPPKTSHELVGPNMENTVGGSTMLQLVASDEVGVKATHYQIDNGPLSSYSKPIAIGKLSEGEHSITYHSTDMVGNSESPKTLNFFVDRTPPLVFEEIVGSTYLVAGKEFSSGRSQLRIVGVDNKAGIKDIFYSINGKEYIRYEKPIYLSDITGAVSIRSYAIDQVGNRSESGVLGKQYDMPEIDISGPTINIAYSGMRTLLRDTLWISPATQITVTATDKGAGLNRVDFKLDDQPSTPYTENISVGTPGLHKLSITAYDNVENLNITHLTFGVDASAPEIFYHFSQPSYRTEVSDDTSIPIYSPGLAIFLAATDNLVGLEALNYTIDQGKEQRYTGPIGGFNTKGKRQLTIRATDRLGNESSITLSFIIE